MENDTLFEEITSEEKKTICEIVLKEREKKMSRGTDNSDEEGRRAKLIMMSHNKRLSNMENTETLIVLKIKILKKKLVEIEALIGENYQNLNHET